MTGEFSESSGSLDGGNAGDACAGMIDALNVNGYSPDSKLPFPNGIWVS